MSTTSNHSRAIFSGRISWNSLWPLRIMIYFIRATFKKFLEGRCGIFHHHKNFKLLSGVPKVIQLVTWYHVLFLGPWTIHFLFQNTRKVIRLSVTKLQTHLTPPPVSRQLDWGGGCSTGTLPFKDKEKRTVGGKYWQKGSKKDVWRLDCWGCGKVVDQHWETYKINMFKNIHDDKVEKSTFRIW